MNCDVCNEKMQEEANIWICINDKCPALREYEGGYKGVNWLKK